MPAASARGTGRFSAGLWSFYRYGNVNQPVIGRAEQVVKAECMARAGFFYRPVPPYPAPRVLLDDLSRVPGKPPTETVALAIARSGDVLQGEIWSGHGAGRANSKYLASLSRTRWRRYQAAVTGGYPDWPYTKPVVYPDGASTEAPKNGCGAQGSKVVYGSVARDVLQQNYLATMQHAVDDHVSATPAVKAATKSWSECMRGASGRSFATPGDVQGWLISLHARKRRRLQPGYLVPMVKCTYKAGLAGPLAAATWKAVQALPSIWYRDLVKVRRWDAHALRKARVILAHVKARCKRSHRPRAICAYALK